MVSEYEYFDLSKIPVFPNHLDMRGQAIKLLEEAGEACEAVKLWAKDPYSVEKEEEARGEMADVAQALVNLLDACHISETDWAFDVIECIGRNEKRGRFDDSRKLD